MSWISGTYVCHYTWPILKQTQLLYLVWWYRLWAACPCLSSSAVAFNRSFSVEWGSARVHRVNLHERALACVQIWNVRMESWAGPGNEAIHTYTRILQCSPASVGLAQACLNHHSTKIYQKILQFCCHLYCSMVIMILLYEPSISFHVQMQCA